MNYDEEISILRQEPDRLKWFARRFQALNREVMILNKLKEDADLACAVLRSEQSNLKEIVDRRACIERQRVTKTHVFAVQEKHRCAALINELIKEHQLSQNHIKNSRVYNAWGGDVINTDTFFDHNWYLRQYPDTAGVDPLMHFDQHGASEGRWPNPIFDPNWYCKQYAQKHASSLPIGEAFNHYRTTFNETLLSANPLFDIDFYRSQGDLGAKAGESLLSFYLRTGIGHPHPLLDLSLWYEPRSTATVSLSNPLLFFIYEVDDIYINPHLLFDNVFYARNAQLCPVKASDCLIDYLKVGWEKGLSPHPLFKTDHYLQVNADVAASKLEPLAHYIMFGALERRSTHPFFDTAWYAKKYGISDSDDTLVDYISSGDALDKKPNWSFMSKWYKAYYSPSLKSTTALSHFIEFGSMAGMRPNKYIDLDWYESIYRDQINDLDPYQHYLETGFRVDNLPSFEVADASRRVGKMDFAFDRHILHRFLEDDTPEFDDNADHLSLAFIDAELVRLKKRISGGLAIETFNDRSFLDEAITSLIDTISSHRNFNNRISHIVCLPFFGTGGSELVACNFAKAVNDQHNSSVLLLTMDTNKIIGGLEIPSNCILINVAQMFEGRSPYLKTEFLEGTIRLLRPDVLHIINSSLVWEYIINNSNAIRKMVKIVGSMFAFQYDCSGKEIGFAANYLRGAIDNISLLITDNERFKLDAKAWLNHEAMSKSNQEKIVRIYNPYRSFKATDKAFFSPSSKSILWAGRLDTDKRIDLLTQIVLHMPDYEFFVFGQAVVDGGDILPVATNFRHCGPFSDTGELAKFAPYSAFIFTSKWEGMPNILIEIGLLGLPIIAPAVGGVPELINEDTGYLLPERPTINNYIDAIKSIGQQPSIAFKKRDNLLNRIKTRHNWTDFVEAVSALGYMEGF